MVGELRDPVRPRLEDDAAGQQRFESRLEVRDRVVDDRAPVLGPGPGGSIEHQPDARAIEEAETRRGLEEESHPQRVAVEGDRPLDVADGDRDLSDPSQSEVGCALAAHERFLFVSRRAR